MCESVSYLMEYTAFFPAFAFFAFDTCAACQPERRCSAFHPSASALKRRAQTKSPTFNESFPPFADAAAARSCACAEATCAGGANAPSISIVPSHLSKSSEEVLLAAPRRANEALRGNSDVALRAKNVSCASDAPVDPSRWFAFAIPIPSSPYMN